MGSYNLKSQFERGQGQGSYSFRKKLLEEERRLQRESKVPGPGAYSALDTIASTPSVSTLKASPNFSLGKDESRFRGPK